MALQQECTFLRNVPVPVLQPKRETNYMTIAETPKMWTRLQELNIMFSGAMFIWAWLAVYVEIAAPVTIYEILLPFFPFRGSPGRYWAKSADASSDVVHGAHAAQGHIGGELYGAGGSPVQLHWRITRANASVVGVCAALHATAAVNCE